MSHEFYQIMVGSPTISLHSWKQLAQWSLEYSCLSEEGTGSAENEKAKAQKKYMEMFESFCTFVEKKYGHLVDAQGRLHQLQTEQEYKWPPPQDEFSEDARNEAFFSAQGPASEI